MTVTTDERHNGVDTAKLFATIDAIKANNEIADFRFRATNTWVSGSHSRSTISGFFGATQEMLTPPRRVGARAASSGGLCSVEWGLVPVRSATAASAR